MSGWSSATFATTLASTEWSACSRSHGVDAETPSHESSGAGAGSVSAGTRARERGTPAERGSRRAAGRDAAGEGDGAADGDGAGPCTG